MSKPQISKKKLLSLVNKNLQEMAMDFTTPDRPESGIQRDLELGRTSHSIVPYPNSGKANQNFEELLASERYQQVVNKMRQYIPNAPRLTATGGLRDMLQLIPMTHRLMGQIALIESQHKEELEQLAVELVKKEMGIPEGALQFEAKLAHHSEIGLNDFNREGNERPPQGGEPQGDEEPEGDEEQGGEQQGGEQDGISDEEFEAERELFNVYQNFDLERAKRRVINSIIQGAAERGHYMYHYVADELRNITGSDDLVEMYGIVMSANDTMYWQVGDDYMKMAMGTGGQGGRGGAQGGRGGAQGGRGGQGGAGGEGGGGGFVAGKEQVKLDTDPPTIVAIAFSFPALVHELIKGVMELFGTRGRSKEMYQDVEAEEDTLENEIWDLRLGPAIWDRLRNQFPEEILIDENKIELQNYLLTEIFELPAKKFLIFFREVMIGSDRGKRLMNILMENVYRIFNQEDNQAEDEEFDANLDEASEQINDEDLMNFLTQLGIKLDNKDKPGLNQ